MIAHVPNPLGLTTIEQVAEANPGWKVEREADGSYTMSPPNGSLSGAHEMALYKILLNWNEKADGQLFSSSAGFTMPDTSMRAPDASWLPRERWAALSTKQRLEFAKIVPDVCIEVVSKSDDPGYLIAKLQRFRGYGAAYVLLIDPFRRTTWSDGTPPSDFPTDFTSVFDAGLQ